MKKHLGVTFLLFVFMAGLLWVSVPGVSAKEKVITLNYANFFPAPSPHSVLAEKWGKEIEKRTNGRVKITFFHGGTLAPAAQIYDSTVQGIADMGFSVLSYTRGKFPLTEVIDLPLGLKNGVTATKLINAYYKKFQPKEFDEVKVLYLHAHGPGLIHTTKKPVAKLEDLKGMKLRATGLSAKLVLALGAAPVGTTMPETYDVLRTGVAEGALAPFMALKDFRWGGAHFLLHIELWFQLLGGFFCSDEQEQVERAACGYSEYIQPGERGVRRKGGRPLGSNRQGRD